MSNPTSNFGWQMPTPTDLVTDLPADFEVFGQAVDTSMADLKGGTTGQILSKATNTDMDFVWIANDQGDITGITATTPLTGGGTSGAVTVGIQSASTSQSGAVQLSDSTSTTSSVLAATPTAVKASYDLANTANTTAGTAQTTANAAIPKSTVTAKGSIVAASASSTPAQLAVGNNGETLVADSSTATGLRWQGSAIGKNAAINGACEIAQRGTAAVTLTAASFLYPVDRFFAARSAGTTGATAQQITSTGLDGFQYAVRVQRTAGNTSTNDLVIGQSFETANSIPFANKAVVVSFWARAGANYSPTSSALSVRFYTGTGTDQSGYGSSFTGTATPISQTATLTTSWQRFQYTATLASTATQMQFLAFCTPTGTAGAADNFDITGLQVELGSVATPFSRSQGTIQGELAACQRYYWRVTGLSGGFAELGQAAARSTTVADQSYPLPVTMRVAPTSVDWAVNQYLSTYYGNTQYTVTSVTLDTPTTPNRACTQLAVASGLTAGTRYMNYLQNTTSAFIGFSAEL